MRAPLVWMGPQAAKSGAAVARRTQALLLLAIGVANLAGTIVVFVFSVWVVSSPDVEDETGPILVNLVARDGRWPGRMRRAADNALEAADIARTTMSRCPSRPTWT